MTTPRKLNLLEKMANMFGVVYRYHALQMPRRMGILKEVLRKELAPPRPSEWGRMKKEVLAITAAVRHGDYRHYTVRQAMVYTAIMLEIVFWFFFGEMLGRRSICGYVVPRTYVGKATREAVKKLASKSAL